MFLRTKSCLLIWILLTTQHGTCDEIPERAQAASIPDIQEDPKQTRSPRLAPLHVAGEPIGLLMHHAHGLTGGPATAHLGLPDHTEPVLHYGHDQGIAYGRGFHKGLLGVHDSSLPLHEARPVSSGNEFNPPIRFVINEHPERNQISGPAFHTPSADQKIGMPFFHANGYNEPGLWYSVTGINSHPTTTQLHYPDVSDHAVALKGNHGVGLGTYYGAGTPEKYNKGFFGPHAGMPSEFHELNDAHGTAGLSSYNSPIHPNHFHKFSIPLRDYYGKTIGHGTMDTPPMEAHMAIPVAHEILPSGHGSAIGGYHAVVNKGHQGLANGYNFGQHNNIHGHGYYQGEYDGGYNGGKYNGNKQHWMGHNTVNYYHGMNGYPETGVYKSRIPKHYGSFETGGPLEEPTLLRTGNQLGNKLKSDQNMMSSMFTGETYLKQEKQDKTLYFGKDYFDHRIPMPGTSKKPYTSESLENVRGDVDYKMEDNNEHTSFPKGMANDMEVPTIYTKSSGDLGSKTKPNINFLYDRHITKSAHPSVLSDNGWSDTPYARGLHVDLLHGGTAIVETESDVQAAEKIVLTESQSGDQAKHITRGGGTSGAGYDSCKNNNNDVEFGYTLVPFTYQPWFYSYGQYYMTPYHSSTDYGYDLRKSGVLG